MIKDILLCCIAVRCFIAGIVGVLIRHMRVHTGEKPAGVTLCEIYLANAACAFADVALLLH